MHRAQVDALFGFISRPVMERCRSFAVHPCGSLPGVCGASGFLFPLIDRHAGGLPVGVGGRRHETMVLPALRR